MWLGLLSALYHAMQTLSRSLHMLIASYFWLNAVGVALSVVGTITIATLPRALFVPGIDSPVDRSLYTSGTAPCPQSFNHAAAAAAAAAASPAQDGTGDGGESAQPPPQHPERQPSVRFEDAPPAAPVRAQDSFGELVSHAPLSDDVGSPLLRGVSNVSMNTGHTLLSAVTGEFYTISLGATGSTAQQARSSMPPEAKWRRLGLAPPHLKHYGYGSVLRLWTRGRFWLLVPLLALVGIEQAAQFGDVLEAVSLNSSGAFPYLYSAGLVVGALAAGWCNDFVGCFPTVAAGVATQCSVLLVWLLAADSSFCASGAWRGSSVLLWALGLSVWVTQAFSASVLPCSRETCGVWAHWPWCVFCVQFSS